MAEGALTSFYVTLIDTLRAWYFNDHKIGHAQNIYCKQIIL